jgi:hypothetical protein
MAVFLASEWSKTKAALCFITLEPVFFLFLFNLGLVGIPSRDLFLAKV